MFEERIAEMNKQTEAVEITPSFEKRVYTVEGASHGGSEKPGKLEVGGASRDSTGLGAWEEGLISS